MATWRQNLPWARRVNLYDVLDDPDHPAFLDLGRLLWTLVTTQRQWVYRRVETVSPVGRRSFHRHLSVDCHVPPEVVDLAGDLGLERFPVPLRILRKAPLLAFDLRLDNAALPLLTRRQNGMATQALLLAAVEQLGVPVTSELEEALAQIALGTASSAAPVVKLLGLADGDADAGAVTVLGGGGTAVGELAGMAPTLVRWAVSTLCHSFLLLADVAVEGLDHRLVFKITDESQLWPGPSRLRSKIGWHPTTVVFDTPDVVAAGSYHFEFRAPPGVVATEGELLAVAAGDEEGESFGEAQSRRGREPGAGARLGGPTGGSRRPQLQDRGWRAARAGGTPTHELAQLGGGERHIAPGCCVGGPSRPLAGRERHRADPAASGYRLGVLRPARGAHDGVGAVSRRPCPGACQRLLDLRGRRCPRRGPERPPPRADLAVTGAGVGVVDGRAGRRHPHVVTGRARGRSARALRQVAWMNSASAGGVASVLNRKQRSPELRDREQRSPSRRRRRPSENGEVYVESIGANVPPVPGSNTTDGSERIAQIARDALDRVRHSVRCRRAAGAD